MGITVNTNMQELNIQQNLGTATDRMNTAMTRMATGSKINTAADDAAGMAVSTRFETTISASKVANQNAQIGSNLLSTTEGTLKVVQKNLGRIRDLAEQAANGTYSTKDIAAMAKEAEQRASQINAMTDSATFNGISLFDTATTGASGKGVTLQIGTDSAASSKLVLSENIFKDANITGLGLVGASGGPASIAAAFTDSTSTASFLTQCDTAIQNVSDRATLIGASQNRLTSVKEGLSVQSINLTAANSTIKDADIAEESAAFVQSQILQSASASLLVQANSAPQIALQLIKGKEV